MGEDSASEEIDMQEQVSNSLLQLMVGDIVRFSLGLDSVIYHGQIHELVEINDDGVGSITIKHFDKKYRERVCKYECPTDLRWISRENVETAAILKFNDLRTKMLIKTTVPCGGAVQV